MSVKGLVKRALLLVCNDGEENMEDDKVVDGERGVGSSCGRRGDKEIGSCFERPTTALVEDQDDKEHMEESDELGSGARGG